MNKSCLRSASSPRKQNVSFASNTTETQSCLRRGNSDRDILNMERQKQRYLIIQSQMEERLSQQYRTSRKPAAKGCGGCNIF